MPLLAGIRGMIRERIRGTRQHAADTEYSEYDIIDLNVDKATLEAALFEVNACVAALEAASEGLHAPSGLGGAVKQVGGAVVGSEGATHAGAKDAVSHDGRMDAKTLVAQADEAYGRAQALVGSRLPPLDPARVKPSGITQVVTTVGGAMGGSAQGTKGASAAANAGVAGGLVAVTALTLVPGGVIRLAVKRVRTKSAVCGVDAMLVEACRVQDALQRAVQVQP
ncbi:hypothetical protein FOA52_002651 [Chlamydomonas sp. UWO 241]|nr:hypothetical protein FOA52_002651 [Chlamydomonas sp. UWO 241]